MADDEEETVSILIDAGYGMKTREPFVSLQIKDAVIQMSPEQARRQGQYLIEAAEAALSDALLFEFITKTVGANLNAGAGILMEFREFRKKRDARDEEN